MGTRKLVIEIIVRVVDPDGTPADVDTSRGDGDVLPIYSLATPGAPGRSGRRTRRPTSVAPPSDAAALAPAFEPLPGGADVVMGGRRWHRAAAGFGLMAIALAALGVTTWHAEAVTPASAAPVTATSAPSLPAADIDTEPAGVPVLRSLGGVTSPIIVGGGCGVTAWCCRAPAPVARGCR